MIFSEKCPMGKIVFIPSTFQVSVTFCCIGINRFRQLALIFIYALIFYAVKRKQILNEEVWEKIDDEEDLWLEDGQQDSDYEDDDFPPSSGHKYH